jgi:hypothetical protein
MEGRIFNEERKMTLCVVGKKMEGQVGGWVSMGRGYNR